MLFLVFLVFLALYLHRHGAHLALTPSHRKQILFRWRVTVPVSSVGAAAPQELAAEAQEGRPDTDAAAPGCEHAAGGMGGGTLCSSTHQPALVGEATL